jgi:hypothetical protein
MFGVVITSVLFGTAFSLPAQQNPAPLPPCHFQVVREARRPLITGPDALVARTHVVTQPGSPLAITALAVAQRQRAARPTW